MKIELDEVLNLLKDSPEVANKLKKKYIEDLSEEKIRYIKEYLPQVIYNKQVEKLYDDLDKLDSKIYKEETKWAKLKWSKSLDNKTRSELKKIAKEIAKKTNEPLSIDQIKNYIAML